MLFTCLAPLLKRLPCPEKVRVQTQEFKANIDTQLNKLAMRPISVLLARTVRKSAFTSHLVLKLIYSIKELDEKSIYTAKEIPDITIKEEFREKQLHREEAVDLMLKIIEIIYNREEPKSFDQYDPVTNSYC